MEPTRDGPHFGALVLINVATQGVQGLLAPLTEEMHTGLGLPLASIGTMQTAFLVVYSIFTPLWGFAAGRFSRRRALAGALLFWGACCLAVSLLDRAAPVAVVFVAAAAGTAAVVPLTYAMALDVVPPDRRGRTFGWLSMAQTLGIGLAFLVGGLLARPFGWRLPFAVFGAAGLLAAGWLWWNAAIAPSRRPGMPFGRSRSPGAENSAESGTRISYEYSIEWRDLLLLVRPVSNLWIVAAGLLGMTATGAVSFWFIGMLRHDHGFSAPDATLLTIGLFAVQLPGAVLLGRLADRASLTYRHGRLGLLLACTLLTLPCFLVGFLLPWDVPSFEPSFVAFVMLMILGAFLSSAVPPLTHNAIGEINPPERRGVLFGLIDISRLLGRAMGIQVATLIATAWYAGRLSPGLGWTALLLLPAAAALIPVMRASENDRQRLHAELQKRADRTAQPEAGAIPGSETSASNGKS